MKNILKLSVFVLIGLLSSCVPPQQETPDEYTEVSNQEFYDQLSPYGHWIQRPSGDYVWIPEAGPDFVPYSTNGYWVWTDSYGWAWASDYSWGWAPFHYGRWDYDPYYGWFWVPDHIWGPAWVCWRGYPGYYGWAPLRPGISIDIALSGGYDPGDQWWTVCDGRYFGRREMRDHYEHGRENTGRIRGGESRVIGNAQNVGGGRRGFVTGPPREQVEAISHSPIQAVKIGEATKPGESISGGTWNIYRPQVQRVSASRGQQPKQVQPTQNNGTPRSQPTQVTQPVENNGRAHNQDVPRSVTTPQDIHDLHEQAKPPSERHEAPAQSAPREQPKQNTPAPRQQEAPRQAPPQRAPQQSAPKSEGRPK
jgi:hypothetical protein